jgi:ubiquinone biosynthesis protein COQ9
MTGINDASDPYEAELFFCYADNEIEEMQALMQSWDQATYSSVPASIVKHAKKHGFSENYLRYLRKAANFNKKSARKKLLPDGAMRWNRGDEFLIERNGKIVTYGEND